MKLKYILSCEKIKDKKNHEFANVNVVQNPILRRKDSSARK